MKKAFYIQLCNALSMHPNACIHGTKLSRAKPSAVRADFLVKILQPFLSTIITDVEMQNSLPHWGFCFSESQFLSYASLGHSAVALLLTNHRYSKLLPFADIPDGDTIEQVFSDAQWVRILEKFTSMDYHLLAETLRECAVTANFDTKKHLIRFALLGGLQQMRGMPLVLEFLSKHTVNATQRVRLQ